MLHSPGVTEIAVDDLGGATDGTDRIEGIQVWVGIGSRGSVNETERCTGLSKSKSTSGANAWGRIREEKVMKIWMRNNNLSRHRLQGQHDQRDRREPRKGEREREA